MTVTTGSAALPSNTTNISTEGATNDQQRKSEQSLPATTTQDALRDDDENAPMRMMPTTTTTSPPTTVPPSLPDDDAQVRSLLLADDRLFVDFLNAFLALPTFPTPIRWNGAVGSFEVVDGARGVISQQIRQLLLDEREPTELTKAVREHSMR